MLLAGVATHLDKVHGDWLTVLSGVDATKRFRAIVEIEVDVTLDAEVSSDPRGKRVARFSRPGPSLSPMDIVQTPDGKRWRAVLRPGAAYLTTDYELVESADQDS